MKEYVQHAINTKTEGEIMDDIITLSYGSGGKKTSELIEKLLLPAFKSDELNKLKDGAILDTTDKTVFSTDSFVVNPYFFPGGDIGKLCICGTVNDVCMCGGKPEFISLSLIIEEGFKTDDLKRIVESIRKTSEMCNVKIVTGDTKVVDRGKGDGIYINTAGIGKLICRSLDTRRIKKGDAVIVTGTVGDHGACIMSARNDLITGVGINSDCTPLNRLAFELFKFKDAVKVMRDPTRGGIATTLNEFMEDTNLTAEISENSIPYNKKVIDVCDVLGLDPLYCANEGKILAVVENSKAEEIVSALRKYPEGKDAAIIGTITDELPKKVVMKTAIGGTRILTKLTGNQLPRIC